MPLDFSPVNNNEMKLDEFAARLSLDDLRKATTDSLDFMMALVEDLDDAAMIFDPVDEDAHDPYAVEGEEHIGWSLAHLIAHVTASSEENAAISSMLARGFPTTERPRYETPWRDLKTRAQVVQRLEESRRMRLAYLDTWPDEPMLDVVKENSPRFVERVGYMNAPVALLWGLKHEVGHHDQMVEVKRQAQAALAKQA